MKLGNSMTLILRNSAVFFKRNQNYFLHTCGRFESPTSAFMNVVKNTLSVVYFLGGEGHDFSLLTRTFQFLIYVFMAGKRDLS